MTETRLPARPVLLARYGVDRACDGHHVLVDRITQWIAAEGADDRRGAIAARGGMALGAAYLAYRVGTPALAVGTPAWIGAAWWHGPARAEAAAVEPTEQVEDTEPEPDGGDRAHDIAVIRTIIGDRIGVHLDELAAAVGLSREQLRARLQRADIPVRRSIRLGSLVRSGVHRGDLEPAPPEDPAPPGPRVDAGHADVEPALHDPGGRYAALDDEPVWPGTTPT